MDNLAYDYVGNQLQWVNDTSGDAEGFDNNGTGTNIDYLYDASGNMTQDLNKGIISIEYNHLNLPTRVDWGSGRYQLTTYDANGIKLQKQDYKADTLHKTIDYIGEFVYETYGSEPKKLKQISHEEGRVVPLNDGSYSYEYFLKDHLGNVRVAFSTTPESYVLQAQFEDATLQYDTSNFSNVDTPNRVPHPSLANTGKAARLNNTSPAGPFTILSVNKGDTINLSVTGYYEGGNGYSNPIGEASMIQSLQDALKASPKLASEGVGAAQIDGGVFAAITALGVGGSNDDNVPGAYLNYLIFDREMNYQGIAGFTQISSAANLSQETISINERIMDRNGYLVAYVSNESNSTNYVYFDNFTVYHGKTNIVSSDSYFPFGLRV